LRTRFLSNQGLKEAALLIGKKHVVSWTSATHVSSLAEAGYLHKLFTELSTSTVGCRPEEAPVPGTSSPTRSKLR
jgi:hypothetical protein